METIILIIVILLLLKIMGIYEDTFGKLFKKHPRVKLIFIVVLSAYVIISGTANVIQYSGSISSFLFPEATPELIYTDKELKIRTEYHVKDLYAFAEERDAIEDEYLYSNNFSKREDYLLISSQTKNFFISKYASETEHLYEEYEKREYSNGDIKMYIDYKFYNVYSIQEIAITLEKWSKNL